MCSCSSHTSTRRPAAAIFRLATRPAGPAPTTMTSYIAARLYRRLPLAARASRRASIPSRERRDGDRTRDQRKVETETRAAPIQEVVAEFSRARQVARGIDLREAGETR